MQGSDHSSPTLLQGNGLRIGIVQARFNASLIETMAQHCLSELRSMGVEDANIIRLHVPGALEIPVILQALAQQPTRDFDALIALGCVIRGETYHFELVANQSAAGLTRVSLDHRMPIANAILTVDNEAQALSRVQEKGRDAARVAVEMALLMKELL